MLGDITVSGTGFPKNPDTCDPQAPAALMSDRARMTTPVATRNSEPEQHLRKHVGIEWTSRLVIARHQPLARVRYVAGRPHVSVSTSLRHHAETLRRVQAGNCEDRFIR